MDRWTKYQSGANPAGGNPAKISRPRLGRIYPRKRLFNALDQASRNGLAWICAPAGSGKTTAVAGYLKKRRAKYLWYQVDARDADPAAFFFYLREAARRVSRRQYEPLPLLTPEYLLGLPVFIRNFFEQLYGRVRPPFILVFDNFQDLPEEAVLQHLLAAAWEIIPKGVKVFILSVRRRPNIWLDCGPGRPWDTWMRLFCGLHPRKLAVSPNCRIAGFHSRR